MDFNGLLASLELGLATALMPVNLYYCMIGVMLGTALGVMPGIGALTAVSLLFPVTFHLDATPAIIMLAGIYYGTAYGGSTAAILLNIPGTPSSAVTCIEGYAMSKTGRAGIALFMTSIASFFGGSIGIILTILVSPLIVMIAFSFGAAEYFALMLLGLIAATTLSDGSVLKGMAMVVMGILFGTVGTDLYTGVERFNFGIPGLADGISIVAVAMGLFGISEVIVSIRSGSSGRHDKEKVTLRSMLPTRDDTRRSWMPMLRGGGLGAFCGTLPGIGGTVASFMAYAVEKRVNKDPSRFGTGAIEGLVAPEAANNAADQTAFIPSLTLGVPGSATMAVILGVLIIHGITPGPRLVVEQPDLFWGLIMSFWVGNIMLLILNIPLIGIWVKLLSMPYHVLYPAILTFCCVGVYTVGLNDFEVLIVGLLGALAYCLRLLDFPPAPFILGFVLGPMLEEEFRRAMLISRGDPAIFISSPISGTLMGITFVLLLVGLFGAVRRNRDLRRMSAEE
ncbi:hypothetical protein LL06_25215 [Hoeflea sp. BAL378]|uniref:tripartite tricarboxylate transporter permease n=1 Tax=Hoeflea sp. BAL378 TaxID=1547437 RepID=UPI0005145B02|nr:tripartite tricarboxylate transporter permease [Hoeflea sp. BAL378]KGF66940.1 hypothetical protein LL06_25215 [Hoeflea sp. BAL378]